MMLIKATSICGVSRELEEKMWLGKVEHAYERECSKEDGKKIQRGESIQKPSKEHVNLVKATYGIGVYICK